MNTIKTIDLWTEPNANNIECFSGAFIDGFESGEKPFDSYKIVRNGNCIITCNQSDINITNKHNAIIFYKDNKPVRLMVLDHDTDIDKCIEIALTQKLGNYTLSDAFKKLSIKRYDIDLKEQPIYNGSNKDKEIDVGSCDRPSLLECMLEGSYTESDTEYGKGNINTDFTFTPNIVIQYDLKTDTEHFNIEHHCAFINKDKTRVIPLQDNSSLNIEEISKGYHL